MTEQTQTAPAADQTAPMTEAERLARIDHLLAAIQSSRFRAADLRAAAARIDKTLAEMELEVGALRGAGSPWKVGDKVVSFHGAATVWNPDRVQKPGSPTFLPKTPAVYRVERFHGDGTPILRRLRRDGTEGKSADVWMHPRDNDYVLVENDDLPAAEKKLWDLWRERMIDNGYEL